MESLRSTAFKKWLIIIMVTLFSTLLAGCFTGLFPQFTYQGVLKDGNGNPYNGDVTITYRLFDAETGGKGVYTETETVTVTDGRFSSVVGPSAPVAGIAPEDLAQPLFMELEIGNGTYTETLSPRQKLYGAPYALTLMPGSVISETFNETLHGAGGIDAIVTINNSEDSNAIPALRVVGEKGLELVEAVGDNGTIYSEIANSTSDIDINSNDDVFVSISEDESNNSYFYVFGDGVSNCYISDQGDFDCTGTKSSVVTANGEARTLYAMESPEVWFEDFGSGALANGATTVSFDPLFVQTVNLNEDYHVYLTPLGDCNGLYVTNKTATGFEVHELNGGTSDISFDYRVVAKRVGYEDVRLEVAPATPEEGK